MSGTNVITSAKIESDGLVVVENFQDVEDIIERNKALKSMPQKRAGVFRHIGSIPNVIICKWLNEEAARGHFVKAFGKEFDELVAKKLKDPEWYYLRTDK